MLGRSVGLTYEKLRHLGDDPLPDGVYGPGGRAARPDVGHGQTESQLHASK